MNSSTKMQRASRSVGKGNAGGFVLLVVMILIVILTLLGLAASRNMTTDTRIAGNSARSVNALYAAEAGAEFGYATLCSQLQHLSPDYSLVVPPAAVNGFSIAGTSFLQTVGGRVQRDAGGTYTGLIAFVQKYRINSAASGGNAATSIVVEVEDQLIPIFQFGIFYDQNMEILPGANMTFSGGRIHSNNDIYLYPDGATLTINSKITSAGDLHHNRSDGKSSGVGTVNIMDGHGAYQALNTDSSSSTWRTDSQTIWDGNVKTKDNGVTALSVPLGSASSNPGDLITSTSTTDGSMYAKAGLRIVNGAAYNNSGSSVNTCVYRSGYKTGSTLKIDGGCNSSANYNAIRTGTNAGSLYDYRQTATMTTTDIDVSALLSSTTVTSALYSASLTDPGVLYVSVTNPSSNAVRLINGGTISNTTYGLTVATPDALYVKGDYNNGTTLAPAALMADAVTVLSNNWPDTSYSSSTGISGRTASATTVNAGIITGNVQTSGSNYSGGVENLVRFLENWSGVTYTFSGSLVCLWQSQYATAKWPGTGSVYNAPVRSWSYGITGTFPPGTPRVRLVNRVGWRQVRN